MNKSAREHYNHLKEIINRSENRAGQLRFGMNVNINQIRNEINRDFHALTFIAEKNAPHKVNAVKRMHNASLSLLDGKITANDFDRIINTFQMDRPMQPVGFPQNRAPSNNAFDIFNIDNNMRAKVKNPHPNNSFVNNLFFSKEKQNNKKKMQKNPFADTQKMFRFGV